MYTKLVIVLLWMCLKSDSLMSVICHDVHEHLLLGEDVIVFAVAHEPESRSLMVKVISYAEIVLSHLLNGIVYYLLVVVQIILSNILTLREDVVRNRL